MPSALIRRADTDDDIDAVRTLYLEWADWQFRVHPEHKDRILTKFEPASYARTVADLHLIHARLKGAMLLARLDGQPAGCVMYDEMEPGVAEIKRLFVAETGRGHDLGRCLLGVPSLTIT